MAYEEIEWKFGGRWKLDRQYNIEEYFKAMKVNYLIRKMMTNLTIEEEFIVLCDNIVIKVHGGPMIRESRFKLNEHYTDERMGAKMKCYCKYEDGKLKFTCEPEDPDLQTQYITREIVDDETVITIVIGDGEMTCTRYFKKIGSECGCD